MLKSKRIKILEDEIKDFKKENEKLQTSIKNFNCRITDKQEELESKFIDTNISLKEALKNIRNELGVMLKEVINIEDKNQSILLKLKQAFMDFSKIEMEKSRLDAQISTMMQNIYLRFDEERKQKKLDAVKSKPPEVKEMPVIEKTIMPVPTEEMQTEIKEETRGRKKGFIKGFRNEIIDRLREKNPRFKKIGFKPEVLRDISIALNTYHEKSIISKELKELLKSILIKYKKVTEFNEFKDYFIESGMLQREQGTWRYTIIKDNTIPKTKQKLGLLEELYEKDKMS